MKVGNEGKVVIIAGLVSVLWAAFVSTWQFRRGHYIYSHSLLHAKHSVYARAFAHRHRGRFSHELRLIAGKRLVPQPPRSQRAFPGDHGLFSALGLSRLASSTREKGRS